MPVAFRDVPDWFSWDNQGGGVAVGSLTGAGTQDLIVLMVDSPAGANQAFYRVGRSLAEDGTVTGGWTPWLEVPDWFSWENQGAGIAVADLDGNGRLDLVVVMVDAPPGANQTFYRVGRSLAEDGTVTAGWTPWLEVPDWSFWENQGASIAVTPPNPQGRRDLALLTVDNPVGVNSCVYRFGRGITADGGVDEWTPWLEVPDWFSWENQGCGVAVEDLAGDGGQDLIVFNLDNPAGLNQAFYRVGSGLDGGSEPAEWGDWLGVPSWFSWENQGAGIAAATIGGARRLVAFAIDAPPQQNTGIYEVVDLDEDPSRHGRWELLPFHSGVLAVHTALLPTGKVLFFAGSGSSAVRFASLLFGDEAAGVATSVVWDPPGNDFFHPPTLRTAAGTPFDFFCGGDSFLPDGRLLSAGGTLAYNPFKGRKDVAEFDPFTEQWSFTAGMQHGRWYPTLTTLADGRVLATTGLTETGDHNETLELYSAVDNAWETRLIQQGFPGLPLYAHNFLLADGRIFFSGGRMDDPLNVDPAILDLAADPVTVDPVPDLLDPDFRNQSASVILPPARDQKVMVCGGGPVGKPDKTDATGAVSIVDLTQAAPAYLAATPMCLPRLHLNAVILPDHTVFVSGGSLKQEDEPLARLQGEIYDPATDTWSLTAAATVPRLYHSTAVLLPDGRVVAAGGNPEGGDSVPWEPPDPNEEMRLEVFSPPYLFRGPRPVITSAPAAGTYGETLTIGTPQAGSIRWASLVRGGVTTHSFDSEQRLVDLDLVGQAGGEIQATVPAEPTLAPPGWYMLFLVDTDGVPSIATFIRLRP